ncbi:MAG TPA: sulfotransferase domain-containing protein [Bacteroidia bacterium]|nr:sulfotransferase domain-containing protein [Bacteroidia bacterium]
MGLFQRIFGTTASEKKTSPLSCSFREDDVFLVSFPKSGNTWVRFLIGNYVTRGGMDFSNGHLFMPDIHFNPEQMNELKTRPRFLKSHNPYTPDYSRVIYLVREGRDTAVSYFHFLKKMKSISPETTFSEYLENFFFAGRSPYGQWNAHVFSWLRDHRVPHLLLVKYEDLLVNAREELRKMVVFSGLAVDEKLLDLAVERSSFASMKEDEKRNSDSLRKLGHDMPAEDNSIVRSGKSNSWREVFSEAENEKFIRLYGDALDYLGYKR